MYGLEVLGQCGKRVKTKIQSVLGAVIRGKLIGDLFAPSLFPTLNTVKDNKNL